MHRKLNIIDPKLQQSLDAFDDVFKLFSKAEMDAIVNEIDAMHLKGPTIEQYLNDFENNFRAILDHEVDVNIFPYTEKAEIQSIDQFVFESSNTSIPYPIYLRWDVLSNVINKQNWDLRIDDNNRWHYQIEDIISCENEEKKSTTDAKSGGFLFSFVQWTTPSKLRLN